MASLLIFNNIVVWWREARLEKAFTLGVSGLGGVYLLGRPGGQKLDNGGLYFVFWVVVAFSWVKICGEMQAR